MAPGWLRKLCRSSCITTLPSFVHAEAHHDGARDAGDLLQVVGGAGRDLAEHDLLRGASAQQHRHAIFEFVAGHQEAVFGWALDGSPARRRRAG